MTTLAPIKLEVPPPPEPPGYPIDIWYDVEGCNSPDFGHAVRQWFASSRRELVCRADIYDATLDETVSYYTTFDAEMGRWRRWE